MTRKTNSFDEERDPLAAFLVPHFGNVYSIAVGYGWTPLLKASIKDFMLLGVAMEPDLDLNDDGFPLYLPDELCDVRREPQELRLAQIEYILENYLPVQIARAYREYAVLQSVTLRGVIGDQTDLWGDMDDQDDAIKWLSEVPAYDTLVRLARAVGTTGDIPRKKPKSYSFEEDDARTMIAESIVTYLSPKDLLRYWDSMGGDDIGWGTLPKAS